MITRNFLFKFVRIPYFQLNGTPLISNNTNWSETKRNTKIQIDRTRERERMNSHLYYDIHLNLCIIFSNMSAVLWAQNAWAGFGTSGDITAIYVATQPNCWLKFVGNFFLPFIIVSKWAIVEIFLSKLRAGNILLKNFARNFTSFPLFNIYNIMRTLSGHPSFI